MMISRLRVHLYMFTGLDCGPRGPGPVTPGLSACLQLASRVKGAPANNHDNASSNDPMSSSNTVKACHRRQSFCLSISATNSTHPRPALVRSLKDLRKGMKITQTPLFRLGLLFFPSLFFSCTLLITSFHQTMSQHQTTPNTPHQILLKTPCLHPLILMRKTYISPAISYQLVWAG